MIFYAKITAKKELAEIRKLFREMASDDDELIFDTNSVQKQEGCLYESMKLRLRKDPTQIVVDSLYSLGKNNREISKELEWFTANNIQLKILNLPITFEETVSPMLAIRQVYYYLAEIERENVRKRQCQGIEAAIKEKRPLGRKRIEYPANWEECYYKWEQKQISAVEFMHLTGLKKGTLYNLIKEYKIERDSKEKLCCNS